MNDFEPRERQPTYFTYPHDSELAAMIRRRRESGEEIDEWVAPGFNLRDAFERIDGPIIELAGPTEIGHYYLDGIRLQSEPTISNLAEGTLTNKDGQKDTLDRLLNRLLDVRHLDLPSDSVDMIVAAHLPQIDEEDFDFSNFNDEMNAEYTRRQLVVQQAVKDFAESGNLDEVSAGQSLRLTAAREIRRCLKPGGFYLADGTETEKAALPRLGYRMVAAINGSSKDEPPYYYMVLQKTFDLTSEA